jgi:hypothetical protein
MKITATSEFHGSLSTTFTGCKEGANIKRLRGPRSNYCLDYSHTNSHVCGCGYPVSRTSWDAGDWYGVENVSECGADGNLQGRGYIRFEVYGAAERHEAEKEARKSEDAALIANLNEDGTFKS